jgi:predicted ester cyclase
MGIARQTVERWWELVESHRYEEAAELAHPDADISMPGGARYRGPAELRGVVQTYLTAFPGMRHEIVHAVETADAVAVELRITMRHDGPFVTPVGVLPPSGREVVLQSCDVIRVDADGRIVAWHTYFDTASLLAELVAAPAA